MSYTVTSTPSAERDLRKLPSQVRSRIRLAIQALADDPRPPGAIKMQARDAWRIRVGNYRVVYLVDDATQTLTVIAAGDRRDVYQQLP